MTLSEENRKNIVNHRIQKAYKTFKEAKGNVGMGFWHTAANRLYYACFYAVTALLIKNGYVVRTHSGVFTLLGKHFVLEGVISKEQNNIYGTLLELRQDGDYDDWKVICEEDIIPLIEPTQKFIQEIEKLINN